MGPSNHHLTVSRRISISFVIDFKSHEIMRCTVKNKWNPIILEISKTDISYFNIFLEI